MYRASFVALQINPSVAMPTSHTGGLVQVPVASEKAAGGGPNIWIPAIHVGD